MRRISLDHYSTHCMPCVGLQWGEGLPDFLFGFLRTVAKFCAIICCKPLAQLKPIHALGHWVAQNIAENKKYLGNVSYIDKGTHTDATQQRRRRRHSGEQPDKWQNGRWSPKSVRVKMRREQSVKSCLENAWKLEEISSKINKINLRRPVWQFASSRQKMEATITMHVH